MAIDAQFIENKISNILLSLIEWLQILYRFSEWKVSANFLSLFCQIDIINANIQDKTTAFKPIEQNDRPTVFLDPARQFIRVLYCQTGSPNTNTSA